jgi:hypothetical protein
MGFIKQLFTLMLVLTSLVSFAQLSSSSSTMAPATGSDCSLAFDITGITTLTNVSQPDVKGWMSFVASASQVGITIENVAPGNTFGKITKVELYGGCGSLNVLDSRTISISDNNPITISSNSLVIGNTYYIYTERSFNSSQCTYGICDQGAVFKVLNGPNCGWSWGYSQPALLGYSPYPYFGFEGACFAGPPNQSFYANTNLCKVISCNPNFYVGYSRFADGLGTAILQNYTVYVFPPSAPVYSVAVNNYTLMLTLNQIGTYTLASVDDLACPGVHPSTNLPITLTDLCSCTNLEVNYVGSPNCNFTFNPNPFCQGQPFCFFDKNQNPSPFFYDVGNGPHIMGVGYSTGCVPAVNSLLPAPHIYTAEVSVTILDQDGNNIPGCSCANTKTFQVSPSPGPINVSANPSVICAGETVTLTANSTGATNYTWVPSLYAGNPLVTNIQGNVTFTVTAGNGTGCTVTKEVTVTDLNCCRNPNPNSIMLKNVSIEPSTNTSVMQWSALVPGGTYAGIQIAAPTNSIITGKYTINSNLTINANNLTIQGADIWMDENSAINQKQNLTINRSYIHGCSKMWKGIHSYAYLTMTSSIFEDAQNLVFPFVATHPGLLISNNIFNKNYNSIYVQGIGFAMAGGPKFYTAGNIFTSRTLPGSIYSNFASTTNTYVISVIPSLNSYPISNIAGSTILSVPSNIVSNCGISINNASNNQNIEIGDIDITSASLSAFKTNYFDGINHGVENVNSKVLVFNAAFQNIIGSATGGFAGVYHNNGKNTTVGTGVPNPLRKCTFNNSSNGVYVTGGGKLESKYNSYLNVVSANKVEFFAASGANASITNNTLTNCNFDLNCFSNGNAASVTFDKNLATWNVLSLQKRYHVFVNELSTASSAIYAITNNTLNGKDVGVFLQNTNKSDVLDNTITTYLFNTFTGSNNGIQLNSVVLSSMSGNTITCGNPNGLNTTIVGINSSLCSNVEYACNNIYDMGADLKYNGLCPSIISKNILNNVGSPCKYGIWLDNSGYTGNIEWPIGPGNHGESLNIFGNFDYTNNGADSYVQNGAGSVIYYSGINNFTNPYNPLVNGFAATYPPYTKSTTNLPNAMICSGGAGNPNARISSGIEPIFAGTLNFNDNPNALAIGKKGVYDFLKINDINTKPIKGADDFMSSSSVTGIGIMSDIERLGSSQNSSDLIAANGINNSFRPSNTVEQTQRDFNKVFFSFKINNTLNVSELNQLMIIAKLCPYTEGVGVYSARALLSYFDATEYLSPCETSGSNNLRERKEQNAIISTVKTLVYPNPASNEIFVETDIENALVEVYMITGQLVLKDKLQSTKTRLSSEKLESGTYIYKISDINGRLLKADKLLISK